MSTSITKHQVKSYDIPSAPPLRAAEIPRRTDRTDGKSVVSLGTTAPPDGQYNTLSRATYVHGHGAAKPGEPAVPVRSPAEIKQETVGFKTFMRNKNFSFGDQPYDLATESRVTQSTAVECAQRTHSPRAVREERQAHVVRMRASNVFGSATYNADMNSTQRISYSDGSSQVQPPGSRTAQIQHQREAHGGTHFSFGDQPPAWKPESTSYSGEMSPERTKKSTRALECSIRFKSPAVDVKDTLRSLKEIDYKKYDDVKRQPTAFSSSEHHMVMGYAPKQLTSLSQASYTPTLFTASGATPSPSH